MFQTEKREGAHEDSVWAVAWPTDDRLMSGSIDETVKVWTPATSAGKNPAAPRLEETSTFPGHFLGVVSLSTTGDGKLCAVSSLDGRLKVWNIEEKSIVKTIDPGPVEAWTVCFHPQGSLLAAGSQSGNVNVFGVSSAGDKPEAVITPHGKFVMAVAYSPCGRFLASGAIDGAIHLFDAASGNLIRKLEGHSKGIRSLSFSADSKTLLSGCEDMTIIVHDVVAAGGAMATLIGHDSWVLSVAHSPESNECLSGGSDKRVRLWDLGQRQCTHTFTEHTDQVWGVAYNPAGNRFVSAGDDGLLVVAQLS